jgi:hypothetical protein
MTTQHDEEHRRGGLRGAVNELFGRGDRDDARPTDQADEHLRHEGETVRPDSADAGYADDPTVARDQGQAQYAGENRQARFDDRPAEDPYAAETTPQGRYADAPSGNPVAPEGQYGGEMRGDPVAQQQTQYGDEVRGDATTPDHVRRGGDPTAAGQVQHGGEMRGDPNLPGQVQYDTGRPQQTRDDVAGDVPGTAGRRDATGGATATEPVEGYRQDTAAGTAATDPAARGTVATDAGGRDTMAAGRHGDSTGLDDDSPTALVTADRAESYTTRWEGVKGEFVDEPRRAVADADALVGELLDELQELFKSQRAEIERGLDNDETSTEDLRVALRRYRSFFDRLLSI